LNNNRGNNRRRGRGNNNGGSNNRQQGGGQLNRIDSRARGNAPQLLEKYRKLAHDAHLNGDRVQEEYYLQFADHYFRVLADQRQRQDEQRQRQGQPPLRDDRWQETADGEREDGDYGDYGDSEYAPYEQPQRQRDNREQGGRDQNNRDQSGRDQGNRDQSNRDQGNRDQGNRTARQDDRADGEPQGEEPAQDAADDGSTPRAVYEPVENPFVREGRTPRAPRPRREERRPRRTESDADSGNEGAVAFDASVLPPAISIARDEPVDAPADEGAAEAKPRRTRARRPRPPADDNGETLEAVS
jgi:hypothetical protein